MFNKVLKWSAVIVKNAVFPELLMDLEKIDSKISVEDELKYFLDWKMLFDSGQVSICRNSGLIYSFFFSNFRSMFLPIEKPGSVCGRAGIQSAARLEERPIDFYKNIGSKPAEHFSDLYLYSTYAESYFRVDDMLKNRGIFEKILELNSKYGYKCKSVKNKVALATLSEGAYFDLRRKGYTRGDLTS